MQATKATAEEVAAAQARLAQLPLDRLPPVSPTPDTSRLTYSPNPLFVGREGDLKRLAQLLKAGATVVATGIGGVGKTQVVLFRRS